MALRNRKFTVSSLAGYSTDRTFGTEEGTDNKMDVPELLTLSGAVSSNQHFIYASGRHGSTYINLDRILPNVGLMASICRELASPYQGKVDVVAGPAVGAIVLAVLTAQALSEGSSEIPAVWADKEQEGIFRFSRAGFADRLRHQRVLVVEDFITTGGTVAKICREVRSLGGTLVGVSAICNRGGVTAGQLSVQQLNVLAEIDFASFAAEDCPLCADAVSVVVDVGHGAEFRQKHPDYRGGFTAQQDHRDSGAIDTSVS